MLKSFREQFRDFTSDRVMEIDNNVVIKDEEYIESDNEIKAITEKLEEGLSDSAKELLEELLCAYNHQINIFSRILYEQGLKDGVEMKSFLKLVV